MKNIIISLTFFLFVCCGRTVDNNSTIANNQTPNITKTKFKYSDLKEFSIDTIEWDKRVKFYTKLDSASFYQIYQDTSLQYIGNLDAEIDQDFFYSRQSSKRGLTELTILSQREGAYCDRIVYLIYDKQGKLISSFRVAGSCRDGGFYENASGQFLNDSTYILLSEDNYKTDNVDKDNIITFSKQTTLIKSNGKIIQHDTTLRTEIKP
jgi:hypothetical protein